MKRSFFCATQVGNEMMASGGRITFRNGFLEIKGSIIQTIINGFRPVYSKVQYSNIKCVSVNRDLIVIVPNVKIECYVSKNVVDIAIGPFGMEHFIKVLESLELPMKIL